MFAKEGCKYFTDPRPGLQTLGVNLWRQGNQKCDISGSIRREKIIKTGKYCVFRGEFRCQSVYDVLSTDELFIYLVLLEAEFMHETMLFLVRTSEREFVASHQIQGEQRRLKGQY